MLEFRTDRDPKTLRHDGDFILQERAVETERAIGREQRHVQRIFYVGVRGTEAESPDQLLAVAPGESVLKIDISRVAILAKDRRVTDGAIVISLQRQFRIWRKPLRPAA